VSDTGEGRLGHVWGGNHRTTAEPRRTEDAPLEREVREAARGESNRTPALVLGGVAGMIGIAVLVLAAIAFLLYWLL
jgi:hypothetical protein